MLETVKKAIHAESKDFSHYYLDYICSVQDRNIELELRYFKLTNKGSDISIMQSVIQHTYEELTR